jgi:hypothetical protein
VIIWLQVVDLDGVFPSLDNALQVRVVPEDGNRTTRVERERLVTRDLDQFGRLDGLIPAGFQVENLEYCVLILVHHKMQNRAGLANVKDYRSVHSHFPESLTFGATDMRRARFLSYN